MHCKCYNGSEFSENLIINLIFKAANSPEMKMRRGVKKIVRGRNG